MSYLKHVDLDHRIGILLQKCLDRRSLCRRRGLADGVGVGVVFGGIFDGDLTGLSALGLCINTKCPARWVAKANMEANTDFFIQRS